jgi:hypothetical protein
MDIKKALLNPTSVFSHPANVCIEPSLTRLQKIEILRRWEFDAREEEVAEEENMGGSCPSALDEILASLKKLDAENDVEHSPPTKHGGE